ncbi:MAG: hypothetical protein ACYCWE_18835 [Eubacteriales bacterium]
MSYIYGEADITLNIRELTISGTIIASQTIASLDPYYNNWLYFEFPVPVPVTPGSIYVIDVVSSNQTHGLRTTGDTYAAGRMIAQGHISAYYDLLFRTYAPPVYVSPMAAPQIAEIILKAEGADPNQSSGQGKNKDKLNLISEAAHHMGTQTLFDGIEMSVLNVDGAEVCNGAYWDAVLAFLNTKGFSFDYTLDNYITDQL